MDEKKTARPPKIHIAPNGMEASITLFRPKSGEKEPEYTVSGLLSMLEEYGVTYGISGEVLERLCQAPIYDRQVQVATGLPATAGEAGYFEYFFERNFSKKPLIRPDGSCDYKSIKVIELVRKGDVIVKYHPSVSGQAGITVRNTPVEPKPVKELLPIPGKGFDRSEDNLTYTANMDGKIVMDGRRIVISPVYEIAEKAGVSLGNVDFNGDVIIHGGVSDGVRVVAAGSITVEGLVENCELQAGGNIYLLKGVKGGEKTSIISAGDVTAQFIEYATVHAAGNIQADVFFKSKISCDGAILLTGKRASVIGGSMSAVEGIEAYNIGNEFGIRTEVIAGITQEKLLLAEMMQRNIDAISDNVEKIKCGLRDFEELGRKQGVSYKEDPRRMQLLRVKIRDESVVAEEKMKLEALLKLIEKGRGAKVIVADTIHQGVRLTIGDQRHEVKETQKRVEIMASPTGIRMERLNEVFIN